MGNAFTQFKIHTLLGTKIAVLGYHTDKDEDGEPADRIVAKTLNY